MATINCYALAFGLLVSLDLIASGLALKGSISLDSVTFEKVLKKFKASVVKFDIMYPYGEKHDEFGNVATSLKNNDDVVVAEVGVQDYGEKDNEDLATRFGLKKDDFPVLMLFRDGDFDNGVTYPKKNDFKQEPIKAWIKDKTGIRILLEKCLAPFDEIAENFMALTNAEKRKLLIEEAKKKTTALTRDDEKKSADIYVKLMQKVVERGDKFVDSEHVRVKNIMDGKVADAKKKEMQIRLNILQSFMKTKPNSKQEL